MTLNEKAYSLLAGLRNREGVEVLEFETSAGKAMILDVGVSAKISDEVVAITVAEASMGTLGEVSLFKNKLQVEIPDKVAVATLSCQLAGWNLKIKGKSALASGPARILAKKPHQLIEKTGYYEQSAKAVLVMETDVLPDEEICQKILASTGAKELLIAAFKGDSPTGLINILARMVEVGVFRLDYLGYDVKKIISGSGTVPLSNPGMFATNDAIIYSSKVSFTVTKWEFELTKKTISTYSSSYGKSFQRIFKEAGGDFYKIPTEIFAPAKIKIVDLNRGKEYYAGKTKKVVSNLNPFSPIERKNR